MKKYSLIFLMVLNVAISITGFATESANDSNQQNKHGASTYQIQSYTISSGGGVISGGEYSLTSSIGQIDAGPIFVGGVFKIRGGFLKENSDLIFKNSFDQ